MIKIVLFSTFMRKKDLILVDRPFTIFDPILPGDRDNLRRREIENTNSIWVMNEFLDMNWLIRS